MLAELPRRTPLSERVEGELINVALFAGQSGAQTAFEHLARYFDPRERERVRDAGLLASLATVMAGSNQPAELAVGLAERALAAMPAGDADPSVVLYVVYVLAYCDRFAAARAAAEALAAQGTSRGSVVTYGFALATLSQIGLREGALREAEGDARRCIETYQHLPVDPLDPQAFLVDVLIELGELDEAGRIVEAATLEGREERWDTLVLRGSRGRLRLAQGQARAALDDLLHCGAQLVQGGATNPAVMAWRSSAALAQLALGERDEARRLAEEELELARSFGASRCIGIALRCRSLVEGHRGGIEQLEESVAELDGSGARLEHARSLCELGAALRRDGRGRAGQEPLREALDLAVRCGAEPLAARAREELAAAGARPRRDRVRGRDALTASELRVAKLAAEGATNREIAQALFVTLRTVETHLTHAYRKLDIGSRAQITEALEAERS